MKFSTRVAIQAGTEVRDASGGVGYTYADLPGHESLPATIMPYVDENRQERYTEAEGHWNVVIQGHHPSITTSMWILHSGVRYEIERVATTKLRKVTTVMARVPSI